MAKFQLLEELEDEPQKEQFDPSTATPMATRAEPLEDKASALAADMLLTALKALSQRTLVALASLQVTLAIGSVLFLAYTVLTSVPAASILQVTGVAIYATFVLLALWLAKRR